MFMQIHALTDIIKLSGPLVSSLPLYFTDTFFLYFPIYYTFMNSVKFKYTGY